MLTILKTDVQFRRIRIEIETTFIYLEKGPPKLEKAMKKSLLLFVALVSCCLLGIGLYKMRDLQIWRLTQYPDDSGAQGMFYSLYRPFDKKLVLVDG